MSTYFDGLFSTEDLIKRVEPDTLRYMHAEALAAIFAVSDDAGVRRMVLEELRLDPWYDGEFLELASRWDCPTIPEEPRIKTDR
jgi:hypothetical protein